MSNRSVNDYIEDAPHLIFHDNIELEDFLAIPSANQTKFNIDLNQFNHIRAMKLPYVFDGQNLKKYE